MGSLYYLACAAGEAEELGQNWLWSTVAFAVIASVVIHGVLSKPVMDRPGLKQALPSVGPRW